jgi:hypothetical protein
MIGRIGFLLFALLGCAEPTPTEAPSRYAFDAREVSRMGEHYGHRRPFGRASEFSECPLGGLTTLDAVLEKVRACIATSKTGWLLGTGWEPELFQSVPFQDNPLDYVETTGPIALLSSDRNAYWVNHVALFLAGISAGTPDPEGGSIGRKPASLEPNGILSGGAMDFVTRLIPGRSGKNP